MELTKRQNHEIYCKAIQDMVSEFGLKVRFGKSDWPESWYLNDPWLNVSIPLMLAIAEANTRTRNFHIWYDRGEDFHHVEFDLQGEHYDIRWYKVFRINRKSDDKSVMFTDRTRVVDFFCRRDLKTSNYWS